MSLSMLGHVDGVFRTVDVTISSTPGDFVEGIWTPNTGVDTVFRNVTIQPLNDKELDFIMRAVQRINDVRKLYVNNGDLNALELNDDVQFLGQKWKIIKRDVRPWRQYAKLIVDRYDDQ